MKKLAAQVAEEVREEVLDEVSGGGAEQVCGRPAPDSPPRK